MFALDNCTTSYRSHCGSRGSGPVVIKGPCKGVAGQGVWKLAKDLEKVVIEQDKERHFQVGSQLPSSEKAQLVKFLKVNIDVFAWSTYNVPRIDLEFICH